MFRQKEKHITKKLSIDDLSAYCRQDPKLEPDQWKTALKFTSS